MTTQPDADELAVRNRLHRLIDGHPATDAAPAAQPTQPDADDWWDALYDQPTPPSEPELRRIPPWWTGRHVDLTPPATVEPEPEDPAEADQDGVEPEDDPVDADDEPTADAQPARPRIRIPARLRPHPATFQPAVSDLVAVPAPRMSLVEAYGRIPARIRWLAVHASAAAVGYRLGWVQYFTQYSDWLAHHGWLNVTGGVWIGLAAGGELLRRYGRGKALVIRWAFAIPMSSLVVGTLLYGTGWRNLELPL